MKINFRPILFILFILIASSFAFSMSKSIKKNQQNREVLSLIMQENQRLKLQEQELLMQEEIMNQPFLQEQLIRDQKWLKKTGENNLELVGFKYAPRSWSAPNKEKIPIKQMWSDLLFKFD
ncbi:MAG: hypothetical protein EOM11_09015 [Erysipelotrichia bacterium]|nr:hypothetical protein [Erysipelotrichia bacterium]